MNNIKWKKKIPAQLYNNFQFGEMNEATITTTTKIFQRIIKLLFATWSKRKNRGMVDKSETGEQTKKKQNFVFLCISLCSISDIDKKANKISFVRIWDIFSHYNRVHFDVWNGNFCFFVGRFFFFLFLFCCWDPFSFFFILLALIVY